MKLYRFKREEKITYEQVFEVEADSIEEAEDKINDQTDIADKEWINHHEFCTHNKIIAREIPFPEVIDVFPEDSEERKPLKGD